MLKAAVLVVSVVALSACASQSTRAVYEKPGVTDAVRKQDQVLCTTSSVGAPRPDATIGALRFDRDFYDGCMKAKGYTPKAAS
jgi:hypothetical protein